MHPALSVIFFTVVSGCGYGLAFLLGITLAIAPAALPRAATLTLLATAAAFSVAGLLASTLHLGQPLRAWRAFSQWRTSWLSREGVAAVAGFIPLVALGWLVWHGHDGVALRASATLLALCAAVTVACTAQIYASLKTIAAWHNEYVLPIYWLLGLLGGAAWWAPITRAFAVQAPAASTWALPALALAAWCAKRLYWASIDTSRHAASPESATGLGAFGRVSLAEAPHSEANYLTNEMGFVVARKHAQRLRSIAMLLLGVAPFVIGISLGLLDAASPTLALAAAVVVALAVTAGLFVERWLFFAEAKHVVMLYYGANAA